MINRTVPFTCLVLILILAGFLRAWDLNENPPEIFPDEVFTYLSAKSFFEDGRIRGQRLPVYGFTSYLSASVLGDGPLGIRMPAVLFGLASIILVYFLAKELFGDAASALFAAFFMAIIPWQIHYSRVGWEAASFLPFLLLSVYLFIYGINRERKSFLIASFGMFALTFYTYAMAPLYSLLLLSCLLAIHRRYFFRERKVLMTGLIVFLILSAPFIWVLATEPVIFKRASIISTFAYGIDSESLSVFGTNYIKHLSPDFLFTRGDPNLRHGGGTGVIYWAMLPLLAAGIAYSAATAGRRNVFYFLLFWLAVFPLAAALTNDGIPHATRSLAGAPVLCLLSGRGVSGLVRTAAARAGRKFVPYILYAVVVIILLVPLYGFSKMYYVTYPVKSAPDWEYGRKKLLSGIGMLGGGFKRVCAQKVRYFGNRPFIEYYLPGSELEFINNLDDPECSLGGSIIVQRYRLQKYWNSRLVGVIKLPDGKIVYYVFTIE